MILNEEDVLIASQKEEPVNPLYLIGNDAYNDLLRQDGEPSIIVRNNAIGADILVNVNFDEGYYDWIQSE